MRKFLQLLLVCLALGLPLTAQTSYILTASPSTVQSVVDQHGLTVVKELYDGTNCVMLVTSACADLNHPALSGALVTGYDFTRATLAASELADLDPGVAAQLQQSTTSILDAQNTLVLTSAVAILNQSTTSILDQSTTSILDSSLAEFGHGTMTAGIVHLVAPTAKIMPLKAFRADGSSNLSDIIRAIYYGADHGANVISMSFSMGQSSPGLQAAVQ